MEYLFKFLSVFYGFFVFCHAECTDGVYEQGVSEEDKNYIVEYHNQLRKELANGEVPGQPRAINLKRMQWDGDIAQEAQNIADTCNFAHVPVHNDKWPVGQNLAAFFSSNDQPHANWTFAITSWWDEHEKYTYPDQFAESTGHYTQLVWDDTQYVGCGYTYYPDKNDNEYPYHKLYVCNYGPAGNFPRAPYETGDHGCEDLC